MSLLKFVFRTGITVGAVMVCQRIWDTYKLDTLEEKLDVLRDEIRRDHHRTGTVRATMTVRCKELIVEERARVVFADTLKVFDERVEIYLQSIPD